MAKQYQPGVVYH